MKLIADANILASSLIKEGLTRKLILKEDFVLYSPDFMIQEIIAHVKNHQSQTGGM